MTALSGGDADRLRAVATAWLDDDPDEASRAELTALIEALPASAGELADRFSGPLTFGTAGLRGPLRAGPNGMNIAVVRAAAAGLVRWLAAQGAEGPLVIGYDARHKSREFAEETARVATGAGRPALLMPDPLPTPVLAFSVRRFGAAAGVMVTASHNPPQDNGYKVYLGSGPGGPTGAGAQIAPPSDEGIEASIRAVGPLSAVPLGDTGTLLDDEIVKSYLDQVASTVDGMRGGNLTVAYTPLHGVGGEVLTAALPAAGFTPPVVVPEQGRPDPEFPTVSFPNPEEPGAMDLVIALAGRVGADLAIANDPDADRCAVAVPDGTGGWRMLRGDEVGVLLADHLMRKGVTGRYATTIVSSSMLRAMCEARGHPYTETLTGFKWIVRAGADLVFGYEEALGYCVAPQLVRDKDGISAALLVCELAASAGSLTDRLDELAAEFGVHATEQLSYRVEDLARIDVAMSRIRADPPAALAGEPVTAVEEPAADVLVFRTASARVVVRPSGTEPKLKAYLEIVEHGPVPTARKRAADRLAVLGAEVNAALGF